MQGVRCIEPGRATTPGTRRHIAPRDLQQGAGTGELDRRTSSTWLGKWPWSVKPPPEQRGGLGLLRFCPPTTSARGSVPSERCQGLPRAIREEQGEMGIQRQGTLEVAPGLL